MTTLKRALTWREGAGFTVAAVLGSGVLVLPSLTATMAGPASLWAWILIALAIIPIGLTLGQLAVRYPDAGGIAAYVREAFGTFSGRVIGYLYLATVPVAAPAAAIIGMDYVRTFLHWSWAPTIGGATLILAAAILANYLGVELSGMTVTVVVVVIAVVMLAAVILAMPHMNTQVFSPWLPHGWIPVGQSLALLFWAFVGWEMLGHMVEEFVNPTTDVPRALAMAIMVIDVLYIAVSVVTIGTRTYGAGKTGDGLAQLVGLGLGRAGMAVIVVLAILVTYGTIHTYVAGFSRLVYAQSRAGDLPLTFAELHRRFRTPSRVLIALIVPFAIVLVVEWVHPLDLSQLILWPSAIFIVLYIAAMGAGWRLLSKPGHRAAAVLGLVFSIVALSFVGWALLLPLGIIVVAWMGGKFRVVVTLNRKM